MRELPRKRFLPEDDASLVRFRANQRMFPASKRSWLYDFVEGLRQRQESTAKLKKERLDLQQLQRLIEAGKATTNAKKNLLNVHDRQDQINWEIGDNEQYKTERTPKLLKERFGELLSDFAHLQTIAAQTSSAESTDTRRVRFVRGEIQHMLDAPQIAESIRKVDPTLRNLSSADDTDKLKAFLLEPDAVPLQAYVEMLERHRTEMLARNEKLAQLYKEVLEDFSQRVTEGVTTGFLPETVRSALPRLESVRVTLMERLDNIFLRTEAAHARHIGVIGVYSDALLRERDAVRRYLFHEFLHVLAGLSVHIDESHTQERIQFRKSGIGLHSRGGLAHRFTWLNEAITEWLALKLSGYTGDRAGYQGSSSYIEERRVLQDLFDAGLEPTTAVNAYFENISSEQPRSERARHFSALIKKVNEISGDPHAFNRYESRFSLEELIQPLRKIVYMPPVEDDPTAEKIRERDPDARLYIVTFKFGVRDEAAFSSACYLPILPEESTKLGTSDEEVIEQINAIFNKLLQDSEADIDVQLHRKSLLPRLSWTITPFDTRKA